MTLGDVGEELNISSTQAYALVRSGELPAIQIGGRGYLQSDLSVDAQKMALTCGNGSVLGLGQREDREDRALAFCISLVHGGACFG
ncbi:helix-turn-helix domain-containing protein [Crystallibacter degradans]|uniref:helix-turn-helix domain-containing protein n=1 Tax=Crystallibacter degradans TaxID=2726743 RepID=UPI001472D246|nr:helix-turn-helix domain-containing protein [Arthrobacter sp. SF27]NMR32495.1 helix-turn-helix domain-containing protein [Arthrobacter sp. SF27]